MTSAIKSRLVMILELWRREAITLLYYTLRRHFKRGGRAAAQLCGAGALLRARLAGSRNLLFLHLNSIGKCTHTHIYTRSARHRE